MTDTVKKPIAEAFHAISPQAPMRFERFIADLSASFINLPAEQVSAHIVSAQQAIVLELGLDRSTIVERTGEASFKISHSWARPGFEPVRDITAADVPWFARAVFAEGRTIHCSRADDLPPDASREKALLRALGQHSIALFPLSSDGKIFGALSFGSLQKEMTWTEELVDRLGLVAQVFAGALARMHGEVRLKKALEEISALKLRLEQENHYLREKEPRTYFDDIVGRNPAILHVLKQVEQVAPTRSTVLLLGETGTGKELLAEAIHSHSPRRDRLLVKVNCAGLAPTLIENELFGRERGAYTGALTAEAGRFELAHNSSIFLDEIGDLPLEIQSKLLRILQEGEFERLGSTRTRKVDVRVIAATNRNLEALVAQGTFRSDLFYRLNVFPIRVPPLRERASDIPAIARAFAQQLAESMGKKIHSVDQENMHALQAYDWPGNIRELRNMVERALILCEGNTLRIPSPVPQSASSNGRAPTAAVATLEEIERQHILSALVQCGWRVSGPSGAANQLGLKRTTLEARMNKLGIKRP